MICCGPSVGFWISLTMTLTFSGQMDVLYNYDEKPDFGFDVSAHDYALDLKRFPRAHESVPAWWRERIAQGDYQRSNRSWRGISHRKPSFRK